MAERIKSDFKRERKKNSLKSNYDVTDEKKF